MNGDHQLSVTEQCLQRGGSLGCPIMARIEAGDATQPESPTLLQMRSQHESCIQLVP